MPKPNLFVVRLAAGGPRVTVSTVASHRHLIEALVARKFPYLPDVPAYCREVNVAVTAKNIQTGEVLHVRYVDGVVAKQGVLF